MPKNGLSTSGRLPIQPRPPRPRSAAKTADRTLDVFELFANEQRPLNLSEIASLLAIPLASSHALIKTLQARGYLYDLGKRRGYFPTTRMQVVVQAISRAVPVLPTIEPILGALRDETGETVVLAKRHGDQVTYVEVFESPHTVRFSCVAGETKPLHSTSSGKAIMSGLPPEEVRAVLARIPFERRTPSTITSASELLRQIDKGRLQGWVHSIAENVPDLMAVAAPVRIGGEIYAVTLGGPTNRFKQLIEEHVSALKRACARIDGEAIAAGAPRR